MRSEASGKHENPVFDEWSSRLHELQADVYDAVRESDKQGNLDARTDWLVQAIRMQH